MYEENREPLPDGDFARVFADLLKELEDRGQDSTRQKITPSHVLRWAKLDIQPMLGRIGRRLLLPGSGIAGIDDLGRLTTLAEGGNSCILCMNHRSNLDVPTLYALLEDQDSLNLFHKLIWIAGRKLDEDIGSTRLLAQAFNRVIVAPPSWLHDHHSERDSHEAHRINTAAHRAIHELRHAGWAFALFPTATRVRPGDESTSHPIDETDSYLKNFEYMLLGRIDGCTLLVSRDRDLTHEMPVLDRVRYTFGKVLRTDRWRAEAARRYSELPQRAASACAIVEGIATLEQ